MVKNCIKPTKNEIKKHIKLQKSFLKQKCLLSVFLKDATEGLLSSLSLSLS